MKLTHRACLFRIYTCTVQDEDLYSSYLTDYYSTYEMLLACLPYLPAAICAIRVPLGQKHGQPTVGINKVFGSQFVKDCFPSLNINIRFGPRPGGHHGRPIIAQAVKAVDGVPPMTSFHGVYGGN